MGQQIAVEKQVRNENQKLAAELRERFRDAQIAAVKSGEAVFAG